MMTMTVYRLGADGRRTVLSTREVRRPTAQEWVPEFSGWPPCRCGRCEGAEGRERRGGVAEGER